MSEPASRQRILDFLERNASKDLLRFSAVGSVDDGKSTLIGRLLHDTKSIYEDQLSTLRADSARVGTGPVIDFALLTDGLRAEREQGITIDVAYRYFSTPRRNFIIADTPGHEQYTRNMATGASTAHLAIILIDAAHGILTQTKRHSFIASLLGIPRLLVAVNKMDLVDHAQDVFDRIVGEFTEFATRLGIADLKFIPISALNGDNVVTWSPKMPWYHGESVLDHLESVYVGSDRNLIDLRLPVQYVIRPHQDFRGYAGQIASGVLKKGEEVLALPSMRTTRVKSILSYDGEHDYAFAPMSVTVTLEDEIDLSRGDLLVHPRNLPSVQSSFEAMLVWMADAPMETDRPYLLKHTSQTREGGREARGIPGRRQYPEPRALAGARPQRDRPRRVSDQSEALPRSLQEQPADGQLHRRRSDRQRHRGRGHDHRPDAREPASRCRPAGCPRRSPRISAPR